jgi:hypothetical protein
VLPGSYRDESGRAAYRCANDLLIKRLVSIKYCLQIAYRYQGTKEKYRLAFEALNTQNPSGLAGNFSFFLTIYSAALKIKYRDRFSAYGTKKYPAS